MCESSFVLILIGINETSNFDVDGAKSYPCVVRYNLVLSFPRGPLPSLVGSVVVWEMDSFKGVRRTEEWVGPISSVWCLLLRRLNGYKLLHCDSLFCYYYDFISIEVFFIVVIKSKVLFPANEHISSKYICKPKRHKNNFFMNGFELVIILIPKHINGITLTLFGL